MPLTILPKEITATERFGEGLQSGLQQLLGDLANQRAQQMKAQQVGKGLRTFLPDVFQNEEQATQAGYLPENTLTQFVKQRASGQFPAEGSGINQFIEGLNPNQLKAYNQFTPGEKQTILRSIIEEPHRYIKNYGNTEQPALEKSNIETAPIEKKQPTNKLDQQLAQLANKAKQKNVQESAEQIKLKENEEQAPQILQPQSQKPETEKPKIKAEEALTEKSRAKYFKERINDFIVPEEKEVPKISDLMKEGRSQKESAEIVKNLHKSKLADEKENRNQYETTKKEIQKAAHSAKDDIIRLDRIEELNLTGNLGFPILNGLVKVVTHGIKGVGIDLTSLMTADAQELDKLSTDFVRNAKQYFGARMTDFDLQSFFKTIPSLLQSKEGRSRVIANMRIFLDAKKIRNEALNELINVNGGKTIPDLDTKIDELAGPLLDNLASQYKLLSGDNPNIVKRLFQSVGLAY